MADTITRQVITKRSQTPRELHNRARNFRLSVSKNDTDTYTATVEGQEHLKADGASEADAIKAVKKLSEDQFLAGTLKVNQKMI